MVGCAPIVMFTGPQKLAIDVDEMAVAGGAAGEAIRMTRCRTIDLDVPADAEIVVEGLIDCDVLEPEAPFGESNGYVALEAFNMPMQVTAITHKKKPVFAQIISQVTPSESSVIKKVAYEPLFLAHLKTQLGVKGIRRVVMHERLTNSAAGDLPAVRRRHAAHRSLARPARRVDAAIELRQDRHRGERGHRSGEHGRGAVVARLPHQSGRRHAYRAQPRRRAGRAIRRQQDRLRAAGRCHAEARRCRRSRCRRANTWSTRAALWEELGLPALNVQAPWHGYTLDDWTDTWETFARRTTAGDWEADRPRDAQAPAPGPVARDAGAAGRGAERRLIVQASFIIASAARPFGPYGLPSVSPISKWL